MRLLPYLLLMLLSSILHAFVRVGTVKKPTSSVSRTARRLTTSILVVGKKNSVEPWIEQGVAEFEKRLVPVMRFSTVFCKDDDALVAEAGKLKGIVIALDEHGKQLTSIDFSKYLYKSYEEGGASVHFIIGGFAGLPTEIKNKCPLISLSKLTWTHQMARLLLVEQIYRATEIHKGSGYHKE